MDNNNWVVKALKMLREEHPQHISCLMVPCNPSVTDIEEFLRAYDCYCDEPIDNCYSCSRCRT
jgi:hypothetical protein